MQFTLHFRSSFERIFITLWLLIVFLLPLDRKILPFFIVLACIAWILQGNLRDKLSAVWKNPVLALPVVFYLLHLAGMLQTENIKTGLSHLEVKFSLLLFPLLFAGMKDLLANHFHKILWAFVFGNLAASLICLTYATYRLMTTGENHFFYSDFSIFNLPTYSSVYTLFAMGIIFYFITEKKNHYGLKTKLLLTACLLLFACMVFLNYSRGAMLSGITAFAFTGAVYFVKRKKWVWLSLTIILPVLVGAGLVMYSLRFEPVRRFLTTPPDSLSSESADNITLRYLVAKQSLALIKENFWLGTGTGDVKDELMNKYSSMNIAMAEHERLNAHNQFLETWMGLGIVGFFLLLLLVLQPIYSGARENNILKIAFGLLMVLNFLFESMLNTEAGVIFFAFFLTLLAASNKQSASHQLLMTSFSRST